jgi:hypothetical protein
LINKGLCCVTERSPEWQEKKKEFILEIAANDPHFFPQVKVSVLQIYFQAKPENLPAC